MQTLPWQLVKILEVAETLATSGTSYASTGEQIAAAFVLDRMEFLPAGFSVVEAWDYLGAWQDYVRTIRQHHLHRIQGL